jgi:cold shock CspA family protein
MPDQPVIANVVEWRNEEGWGVLEADEILERIWVHFSAIVMDGYKTLRVGEPVEAQVEGPLDFLQDGYRYCATCVRPLS